MKAPTLVDTLKRYPLATYFVLTFTISWGLVLLAIWPAGFPARGAAYVRYGPLVFLAMLPGPSVAGVGLTALLEGRPGLRRFWARARHWRVGTRWYGALLVTPAALILLALLAPVWPVFTPGVVAAADKLAVVQFAAYRVLIAWAYAHTGSLLAQLMHVSFVAAQGLLSSAAAPSAATALWYGTFAGALWLVVAAVLLLDRGGGAATAPALGGPPSAAPQRAPVRTTTAAAA